MTSAQKTLIAGCILGLLGAGGAILFARYEQGVQAYYGTEPQRTRVSELAQIGLEGKHWVELTDGQLGPRAVVSTQRGAIEAILTPVFPKGAGERPPIQVVLRSSKCRSLEEFGLRLRDRKTHRGEILEPSSAGKSRELLAASYPGHVLAQQIWVVDIDFGGPSYSSWTMLVNSASLGLLVFGVICLLGFIGSCFTRKDYLPAQGYEELINAQL